MKITSLLAVPALMLFMPPILLAADHPSPQEQHCREALAKAETSESDAVLRRDGPWRQAFALCQIAEVPLDLRVRSYLHSGRAGREATPIYEEAIALVERKDGAWSKLLPNLMDWLATNRFEEGRASEAFALEDRALDIRERAFGPKSPEMAYGLMVRSALSRPAGKLADAEQDLRRSWEISKVVGCGAECAPRAPLLALYELVRDQPGREEEAQALTNELERLQDAEIYAERKRNE